MPTPPLTYDLAVAAVRAVQEHGTIATAARVIGIASPTLRDRLKRAKQLYGLEPFVTPKVAAPIDEAAAMIREAAYRRDIRDGAYWQRRAREMEALLTSAEHAAEQLAGIRAQPVSIPDWVLDTRTGNRAGSVIGCLISDIHMGEVIAPGEILGLNAFNPEIAAARIKRYFEAALIVGNRWASDTDCRGVVLTLAGDLVSGSIHHELAMTNALTEHEQVLEVVAQIGAGIRLLLREYPAVHVVAVPGNHGRTTIKPTAKLYARLSYDILVASILAEQFRADTRVTWQYGEAKDQITPIFGRTIFSTHGDKIGTRGGMGFAGPDLPIVRGGKKIREQQASVGWTHDLIQFGHYHYSTNPANGRLLGNGSIPGYSEYASDLRAVVEPPQQWLYLLHQKWWLRERAPIQLEEPRAPEKPRVRIPATMAA